MNKYITMTSLFLLVLTGGCTSFSEKSSTVILQNPETMEFVNCKVGGWASSSSYTRNEQCVEDYKKQGYIVWGQH